jgi:CMP-N,N'-diacetyllegionaminic acid synthase
MPQVIGLIPARAGSKGLVGKNIRLLNGKPLLGYSVDAARDSGVLDEIIVSSDGKEVLELAASLGVNAEPRAIELAGDDTPMDSLINALIEQRQFADDDIIVLLQPTSPLRTGEHIRQAYQWLIENDCDGLVSVTALDKKILKASVLVGNYLEPIYGADTQFMRRQELPDTFLPNGAIYIFSVAAFRINSGIPRSRLIPFVMRETESMDIDTEADLMRASHHLMGMDNKDFNQDSLHG